MTGRFVLELPEESYRQLASVAAAQRRSLKQQAVVAVEVFLAGARSSADTVASVSSGNERLQLVQAGPPPAAA